MIMWAFVITLRRSSFRTQLLKIFSSETTWPLKTKLWWNGSFWNCVRQSRHPTNMVTVTKSKKEGWNLKNPSSGPIGTKLCLVLWWPPFKIVSGNPDIQPTWPLLLKTEKVDEFFFPLKLLGQLDSSFAKIIFCWSPFTVLSGRPVLGPRWTLLLKFPCKVLHVLSNSIKPICLGYFSEILFGEEYNICASSYIFF